MKTSTWVLVIIAVVLAVGLIYLNQTEPLSAEEELTPVPTDEYLISDFAGQPTSITIKNNENEQVAVMRNEPGEWVFKQPIEAKANQGLVEAAATQLTSLRIISRVPDIDPEVVGLKTPAYTLTYTTGDGSENSIAIGDLAPTGSGYYSRVNGSDEVLILAKAGIDSLLVLLESPPYENTPVP